MMNAPRRLAFAAFALLAPGLAQAAAVAEGTPAARAALEAARAAYREAVPFRETLELTVEFPDGRKEPKTMAYGVGKEGAAFLTMLSAKGEEIFRIVARDGRLVATQINVPGSYAEVPSQGDFAAALDRIGGAQANMAAPPGIVAAQGGDLDAFVAAFRLGILEPVEIVGFRPAEGSPALVRSTSGQPMELPPSGWTSSPAARARSAWRSAKASNRSGPPAAFASPPEIRAPPSPGRISPAGRRSSLSARWKRERIPWGSRRRT